MRKVKKLKPQKLDKSLFNAILSNRKRSSTILTIQNKEVSDMYRKEEKEREKRLKLEEKKGGFRCCNCGQWVPFTEFMGTEHRNHCSSCLWSKHVDLEKPGDRKSKCQAGMKPIGLTFKHEGVDKYGRLRQGELMLIHECTGCGKISINRIAADDNEEMILKVFSESQKLEFRKRNQLEREGIELLQEEAREKILAQLFGKAH